MEYYQNLEEKVEIKCTRSTGDVKKKYLEGLYVLSSIPPYTLSGKGGKDEPSCSFFLDTLKIGNKFITSEGELHPASFIRKQYKKSLRRASKKVRSKGTETDAAIAGWICL